jgi:hypothetical protein
MTPKTPPYLKKQDFWQNHRLYVLDRHYGKTIRQSHAIAAVGNGLLLDHLASHYNKAGFAIDPIDLSQAPNSESYNSPTDQTHYDLIFLLTVLEAIPQEIPFLQALLSHLQPGGKLILDVPMQSHLYSPVDRAIGRLRRYDTDVVRSLLTESGFDILEVVQWGHVYNGALRQRMRQEYRNQPITNPQWVGEISNSQNTLLSWIKRLDHIIPPFGMGSNAFFVAQRPMDKC